MPDYLKSKIYKIICNKTGLQYFGSTVQTLAQRLTKHKCMSNGCKSKEIIVNGDYNIILVEEYPCENKYEIEKRERFYIETNDCINKSYPTRTPKEYWEANKEKLKQNMKIYYDDNRDKLLEQKKQYVEDNREKIEEYQKQYYEDNRDTLLEQKKQYYEDNKEKMKEYKRQYYLKNKKNNNNNI